MIDFMVLLTKSSGSFGLLLGFSNNGLNEVISVFCPLITILSQILIIIFKQPHYSFRMVYFASSMASAQFALALTIVIALDAGSLSVISTPLLWALMTGIFMKSILFYQNYCFKLALNSLFQSPSEITSFKRLAALREILSTETTMLTVDKKIAEENEFLFLGFLREHQTTCQ